MYKNAPFEKLPSVKLSLMDRDITFLADSGATASPKQQFPQCRKSERSFRAAGGKSKGPLTVPLTCFGYGDKTNPCPKKIRHSFMLSETCLINL